MADKTKRKYVYRIVTEILALVLLVVLIRRGSLQLWFVVFAGGLVVSFFAGRFFCGWLCPMQTLFRPIGLLYRKLGIRRVRPPRVMRKPWVRIAVLVFFLGVLVLTRMLRIQAPVLLYLIGISVVLTLVFTENLWHRYLCPFGTLLSLTSRSARKGLRINDACISCGKCEKVCPSDSIYVREEGLRGNRANECLLCYSCQELCPVDACNYQTI